MNSKIEYREFKESDLETLKMIVVKTWGYDEVLPMSMSKLIAERDLLDSLNVDTYTQIALDDGVPVGFIIGRKKHYKVNHIYTKRIEEIKYKIRHEKYGLIVDWVTKQMHSINKKLLQKSKKQYDAQILFFALNLEYKGKGIGKTLYNNFIEYLKKEDIHSFYLFTDTDSDYTFYEHYGMKRVSTRKVGVPFIKWTKAEFYLYDYDGKDESYKKYII